MRPCEFGSVADRCPREFSSWAIPGPSAPVMVKHHVNPFCATAIHFTTKCCTVVPQVVISRMSIARANGEEWTAPRSSYDELEELRDAFIKTCPKGTKYFAILRMRLQWKLTWREIAETVSLHRSHCWRVYRKTRSSLQALGEKNSAGSVARLRIVTADDDDE